MDYYGLASKAGKVAFGAGSVKELILNNKVYLVIIAEDASSNTREKFLNLTSEKNIKLVAYGSIEENSKAIGKKNKAIIAIKDKNFSDAIAKIIDGGGTIGEN